MNVRVDGISVELTAAQIKYIEQQKRKRDAECRTLVGVLKNFGFVKFTDWEDGYKPEQDCYQHPDRCWWAEIIVHNERQVEVWLVGAELKCGGFPDGYNYGTPELLKEALLEGLEKYAKSQD